MEEDLITLQSGEEILTVAVTQEEREKILNDESYALQFFNLKSRREAAELPELAASVSAKQNEEFIWNDKNTLLLLEEYRKRKEKFRDPKIKKKDLWREISTVFQNNNYIIHEDAMDKKFRNLKQTFMRIKDNQNIKKRSGTGNIDWKYYKVMLEIFFNDCTSNTELPPLESVLPGSKKAKLSLSSSNTLSSETVGQMLTEVHIDPIDPSSSIRCDPSTPSTSRSSHLGSRKNLLNHRQDQLKVEKESREGKEGNFCIDRIAKLQ